MSQRQSEVGKPRRYRRPWLGVLVGSLLFFPGALYFLGREHGYFLPDLNSAQARVLETRIVEAEPTDGQPAQYRLEAHVVFEMPSATLIKPPGRFQDRWVPVSGEAASREALEKIRAQSPGHCHVVWRPQEPETAQCRLQ